MDGASRCASSVTFESLWPTSHYEYRTVRPPKRHRAEPYSCVMSTDADPAAIATAVAEEYVDAFTSRDLQRSRNVLNDPSVRLASGRVATWEQPEDYAINWDALTEVEGWHHSTLDSVEVIQAGTDKVHIAASFSQYDADDAKYATS